MIALDAVDREAIYEELRRTRVTFRHLVEDASPADLARPSNGTRWTNQQLLFLPRRSGRCRYDDVVKVKAVPAATEEPGGTRGRCTG